MKAITKMLGAMVITAAIFCGMVPGRVDELLSAKSVDTTSREWADFVPEQRKKLLKPFVRTPERVNARGFILKEVSR